MLCFHNHRGISITRSLTYSHVVFHSVFTIAIDVIIVVATIATAIVVVVVATRLLLLVVVVTLLLLLRQESIKGGDR